VEPICHRFLKSLEISNIPILFFHGICCTTPPLEYHSDGADPLFRHYHTAKGSESGHTRIIWTCAWSHNSCFFATGSRDKILNIWRLADEGSSRVLRCCNYSASEPITAVDFAPLHGCERQNLPHLENYLLAAGLENGTICLLEFNDSTNEVRTLRTLDRNMAFAGPVNAIRFRTRNVRKPKDKQVYEFASCSSTNIMKIYNIYPAILPSS